MSKPRAHAHVTIWIVLLMTAALVAIGCGESSSKSASDKKAPAKEDKDEDVVERVGEAVLDQVEGKDVEDAQEEAADNDENLDNPLEVDEDELAEEAKLEDVIDPEDEADEEGVVSIDLTATTPGGKFVYSDDTPPVIAFAVFEDDECHGGAVSGFPELDDVREIELDEDEDCSANSVGDVLLDEYVEIEDESSEDEDGDEDSQDAGAGDDLVAALNAAYTGAYDHSTSNSNYFARSDADVSELHDAIEAELEEASALEDFEIEEAEAADEVIECADEGEIVVRVWTNHEETNGGDQLAIGVVTDSEAVQLQYAGGGKDLEQDEEPTDCEES
jgi:hypothetical protein